MKRWTPRKHPNEIVDTSQIGKKITAADFIEKTEEKIKC